MSALFVADLFEIRPYGDIIYRIGADHFDAQKILHDHQADLKQTDKPRSLRIQTNATYGGMGINGRLYPDGQIRQGSPSWIKDYPKPFLLHHKSGTGMFDPVDPIGRHRGYRFQSFMPGGKDSQDDTLKEGGTSVLNTEADIVDPDSIQKIIDGRYKTTSVGFTMASANCTICEKDWKAEGPCEHVPNRVYESKNHRDSKKTIQKICLLRCSGIKYQEQSFVNVPAAPLAGITSFKNINDALERMDGCVTPTSTLFIDSLTIGNKIYTGLLAADKEVITLSDSTPNAIVEAPWVFVPTETTTTPKDNSPDLGKSPSENLLPSTEDTKIGGVLEALRLLISQEVSKQAKGQEKVGDKMVDNQDKPAETAPAKTEPVVVPVVPEKDSVELKAEVSRLTDQVRRLESENLELAKKVKDGLAQRLTEIRVRNTHPAVTALTGDTLVAYTKKLSERSTSSLEDAIQDESIPDVKTPPVKSIERGSVTSPVQADRAQDEPTRKDATNKQPTSYKDRVAHAFSKENS